MSTKKAVLDNLLKEAEKIYDAKFSGSKVWNWIIFFSQKKQLKIHSVIICLYCLSHCYFKDNWTAVGDWLLL